MQIFYCCTHSLRTQDWEGEWPVTKIIGWLMFLEWPSFLQAVVVVGCPLNVALVKGLVHVHTAHGGFDSCVLWHAFSPLLQLWCVVKAAKKRGRGYIKSFTLNQILTITMFFSQRYDVKFIRLQLKYSCTCSMICSVLCSVIFVLYPQIILLS